MSGDDDSSGWQLTESDPGVFTELLRTLEARNESTPLMVDDLYSLDAQSLALMAPIHALIFLFKWIPTDGSSGATSSGESDSDFPGFFAHQVVNNACATLAVLNALGNIPTLKSGAQLSDLIGFTTGMDPQTRGLVITSADWLREAHNSLSPPNAVSLDGLGLPKSSEDAYHFVVYLPYMGALYELDGLKPHAVRHGAFENAGEGWLKKAREVIEARISTYPDGALDFSLLAVRDDPIPALQAELERTPDASEAVMKLANENAKRDRWAFENSLRRHNHLGLLYGLSVALAKAGKLEPAKEAAKKTMKERLEKRATKGEDMDED